MNRQKSECLNPALCRWLTTHASQAIEFDMGPRVGVITAYCLKKGIYNLYLPRPHKSGNPFAFWAHLAVGEEKAMLIDSGHGLGDLKSVIDELSGGKQLYVVNTHFHGDHTLGYYQFSKVFCHELEAPALTERMYPNYFMDFCKNNLDPDYYQPGDIIPFQPYKVIPCQNHYTFSLGAGHEIELIWLPGHTSGSCCYLDKKNRIIFSGDALLTNQPVKISARRKPLDGQVFSNVTSYYKELKKLADRVSEFDFICDGHTLPYTSSKIVHTLIKICQQILMAPNHDFAEFRRKNGSISKVKSIGDTGIMYIDETVYTPK